MHGLRRKVRRALEQIWRKEKKRSVPSPSSAFRYLSKFHDPEQEKIREQAKVKAFIPGFNEHLKGLLKINKDMCASLKVFGIVTNIGYENMNGEDLIHWLHVNDVAKVKKFMQ